MIPLTFGDQSNWPRNVRFAGQCTIKLRGKRYTATRPEIVEAKAADALVRSAFHRRERIAFRLIGITHFMRLQLADTGSEGTQP